MAIDRAELVIGFEHPGGAPAQRHRAVAPPLDIHGVLPASIDYQFDGLIERSVRVPPVIMLLIDQSPDSYAGCGGALARAEPEKVQDPAHHRRDHPRRPKGPAENPGQLDLGSRHRHRLRSPQRPCPRTLTSTACPSRRPFQEGPVEPRSPGPTARLLSGSAITAGPRGQGSMPQLALPCLSRPIAS